MVVLFQCYHLVCLLALARGIIMSVVVLELTFYFVACVSPLPNPHLRSAFMPLRYALTGSSVGCSMPATLSLMDRATKVSRIDAALKHAP